MTETPKPSAAPGGRRALFELIAGKWISQAVSVGAELGIADILRDGPRSAAEIAIIVGASEDAVFRLLRALASVGLLSSESQRFALTVSGNYLRSDVPGSLRGWARFVGHAVTWRPWGELAYSVRTGKPAFDQVFGAPIFEYLARDADAAAILNEAMTSTSSIDANAVVQAYDFSPIRTLVDVGGGHGLMLATVLKANPHMRGVLFELPHANVLWFRLSRRPGDPDQTMGRFDPGRILVSIYRGEHWQFGYVVPKGGIEDTHRRGLPAFRAEIASLAPYAAGRVDELSTWDDVKILTVKVDRLREWCRPGLLCIGDAAHAMSLVGGIGINLAVRRWG